MDLNNEQGVRLAEELADVAREAMLTYLETHHANLPVENGFASATQGLMIALAGILAGPENLPLETFYNPISKFVIDMMERRMVERN